MFLLLFRKPVIRSNDNLNGVERPVSFDEGQPENAEIVPLAKWKRYALQKYGFAHGEGLYTDMIAIRRDEDLDNIHSVYVDQWDWERSSARKNATWTHLFPQYVLSGVLRKTEKYMAVQYDYIEEILRERLHLSAPRNWSTCILISLKGT